MNNQIQTVVSSDYNLDYNDEYYEINDDENEESDMPKYLVTIQAIITKTYEVEAADEDEAVVEAHEQFNCSPEASETYAQETVHVELVEGEKP